MAWSALNEEACPVPEVVLGKFQGSETPDAVEIAKSLPEAQRAQLAVFCYRKRHLHALGLYIAATCELNALLKAAGPGGEVIYKQSRDPEQTLEQERRSKVNPGRNRLRSRSASRMPLWFRWTRTMTKTASTTKPKPRADTLLLPLRYALSIRWLSPSGVR